MSLSLAVEQMQSSGETDNWARDCGGCSQKNRSRSQRQLKSKSTQKRTVPLLLLDTIFCRTEYSLVLNPLSSSDSCNPGRDLWSMRRINTLANLWRIGLTPASVHRDERPYLFTASNHLVSNSLVSASMSRMSTRSRLINLTSSRGTSYCH